MSTFDHKVEAVTDFLRNRASLRRVTTYDEVGRVAGELLALRAQRHTSAPVSREKIAEVMAVIDKNSLEDKGILLSALIVHFWDNSVGHRFHDQAYHLGVADSDTDPTYRKAFHASQLEKVFAAYPDFIPVNLDQVIIEEDDAADSDDEDLYVPADKQPEWTKW